MKSQPDPRKPQKRNDRPSLPTEGGQAGARGFSPLLLFLAKNKCLLRLSVGVTGYMIQRQWGKRPMIYT